MNQLGVAYSEGGCGMSKDELKALDYWIKAVELGSEEACSNIGKCFREGTVISKDYEKNALFERVGALRGDYVACHNAGCTEYDILGNYEMGIRHWKVSAKAGHQLSLNLLRKVYNADKMPGKEFISKSELDDIYRLCHRAQEEVNSEERQKHRSDDNQKNYGPGLR